MAARGILGIGVDLLDTRRLVQLADRRVVQGRVHRQNRFLRRVLTNEEHREFERLKLTRLQEGATIAARDISLSSGSLLADPVLLRFVALRWAAKEATYKACFPFAKLTWQNVSIAKRGAKPSIRFHDVPELDRLAPMAHLSVSHDGDHLVAMVVVEGALSMASEDAVEDTTVDSANTSLKS
ncbi:hypothetical protein AMAG_10660 [Allomyces macrogynus ATCC 38327]|uniref:4'-phosphopantetheinyl transferase domain-containing protein n=1 Tax=Allomyces macrogynus (strain ATCC 38327) TaxID=578462 RepID=A0A0L0SR70_ALLM3|nr:hypothetical protein AMAG_10660 [Allomyces macrogynus ATCC 38327]|eukprot:KNE64991.1 hypothetical protein AMAG_10660 [Allomyces macrogynus ATCC 38327]